MGFLMKWEEKEEEKGDAEVCSICNGCGGDEGGVVVC